MALRVLESNADVTVLIDDVCQLGLSKYIKTPPPYHSKVGRKWVINGVKPRAVTSVLSQVLGKYNFRKHLMQRWEALDVIEQKETTVDDLAATMQAWNLHRRTTGTLIHAALGFFIHPNMANAKAKKLIATAQDYLSQFSAIVQYLVNQHLVVIAIEEKVQSQRLGLKGQFDYLCFDTITETYVLLEVKTKDGKGEDIWQSYEHGDEKAEDCQEPFCAFAKSDRLYASLQIRLYAELIKESMNIVVDRGLIIVIDCGRNEVAIVEPVDTDAICDIWFNQLSEQWTELGLKNSKPE